MSYISKHVPDVRKAHAPLDNSLKPDVKFLWENEHQQAFDKCKSLTDNTAMLAHFDPTKQLVLTTDASPHGRSLPKSKGGYEWEDKIASYCLCFCKFQGI